jgi:hypothetical protein
VGATIDVSEAESDTAPLAGTVLGGRGLFGVKVSPRVAIEFEPSFTTTDSVESTYRPTPTIVAHVVTSRWNAFYTGQVRLRFANIEPVMGLSYLHAGISESGYYLNASGTNNGLAVVGGVDVGLPLTSRIFLVPTIRVLVTITDTTSSDPLRSDTDTGALFVRYGAGVRVVF